MAREDETLPVIRAVNRPTGSGQEVAGPRDYPQLAPLLAVIIDAGRQAADIALPLLILLSPGVRHLRRAA